MGTPQIQIRAVVLGSPDPRGLAGSYRRLLGWEVAQDEPEAVRLTTPGGGPGCGLSFQYEPRPGAAGVWTATTRCDR